ncbi:aldose epimerase family protein [Rhodobacter maris]|uniref:Aldose 1-epimerase n=1 Tax=Rhodobacter maris TaxID=446682 RepID=A0A285RF84_9RHOB|nr:aldose epimerase family protein [Rhodobacter maris]SOB92574.1 aldose 1-epimerase [Rhodobacter maris]
MPADIRRFGTTSSGGEVRAVTLRAGELTLRLLTYGATLQDLRLAGTPWPLILGADSLRAYETTLPWCGAVVGPVANRLAGARVVIAGECWQGAPNDGPHLLHSGAAGISQQIWEIEAASASEVTFRRDLAHGACALPGNRVLRARYRILPPATLAISLSATSDAETLMNLAHHPYWTLDGTADTRAHRLEVAARRYLPVDAACLPLAPVPVASTGYDLREARQLSDLPPLDHNYCLEGTGLREVARLTGASGVALALETDAPGLQVYDGRAIASVPVIGLTGVPYGPHAGLALEPQMWPDAPNHEDFPAITLAPGIVWQQETRLHLHRDAPGSALGEAAARRVE